MCDHENREDAMTVVELGADGVATVWCDPCLEPIVSALNRGGIHTIASCCGHGRNDPSVALSDGRWLVITPEPPVAYQYRPSENVGTDRQVEL